MNKDFQPVVFKPVEVPKGIVFPALTEGRILVMRDEVDEKTKGGLYLPAEVQKDQSDSTSRGTIVAMGAMVNESGEPIKISGYYLTIGGRVAFGKYTGAEFQWANMEFLMMRVEDIFATWHKDTEDLITEKIKI